MDELIKLNIGCGYDIRNGWVNIDSYLLGPSVLKMDATKLEFPDNSINEICARDVLEHVSWRKTESVLQEWYRVLKPGGKIYIQSPNLVGWARALVYNKASFHHCMEHIFAHQDFPTNFHMTGFSIEDLKQKMEVAGFKHLIFCQEDKVSKVTDDDTNVCVWGEK